MQTANIFAQVSVAFGKRQRGTVTQRGRQWVFPTPNLRYSRLTKAVLQRWPALNQVGYRFWKGYIEHALGRATVEPCWQRRLMTALCRWNLRWINEIREGRVASAAPTETATKDYNEAMKATMPQTIWVTGCKSWYLGKDGMPELFPWVPRRHRELLRTPDTTHFDVRTG